MLPPRIPVPSIPWLSQYCRCLSIDYIAKILCIQVGIGRKKFLAERGDWCKKRYLSPGVLCKGNSRGDPVHQQTGPWQLMNSECWPSFPHLRNTTPSANWADPLLPQASLFSKDMARHPLLGISGAIKDVTALRYMWPFSSWGCSVAGEGSLNASPPTSVQSKAGELKPSPVDGWEETPGAWQRIWLLQQLATWLCG